MHRLLFVVAFILTSSIAQAVDKDSVVRWNELIYATTAEQQIVKSFLKENNKDYIKAFLANAPDPEDSYKRLNERLNDAITEIQKTALKKRNDRKISIIEDIVRQRFLRNYESMSAFYELMVNGSYNTLTATALYGCIFEKLSIPYRIVETEKEVHLVAYPDTDKIKINTTATVVFQYRIYSHEFQQGFIDAIVAQKVISQDEYDQTTPDVLFKDHFFGDPNISLTDLVGMHYMHDAMHRGDNKDFGSAYAQMLKSYLFYPSPKSEFGILLFNSIMLNEPSANALTRAMLLGRITRFDNRGIKREEITGQFRHLSEEVLFRYNDRSSYAKCLDLITSQVSNKELSDTIRAIYYTESGRAYHNMGNYTLAKPELARAMDLQPKDEYISTIFTSALTASFGRIRNSRMMVDSVEFYLVRYPTLADNVDFQVLLANAYAFDFGSSYTKNIIVRAEKYKQLFEDLMTQKKVTIRDENVVAYAYSEAAAYYLRKGQKTKAKALVDRGLEFAPESYVLKERKKGLK